MIIEFKTAKNTNGHRKYLAIDTENNKYSTFCTSVVTSGIEIKSNDYKGLIEELEKEHFQKVERI